MAWPGWPGASHASTRAFAALMADSGTVHLPTEFWSSLESTKGYWGRVSGNSPGVSSLECKGGNEVGVPSILCPSLRLICESSIVHISRGLFTQIRDGDSGIVKDSTRCDGSPIERASQLTGNVPSAHICSSALAISSKLRAASQSQSRRPSFEGSLVSELARYLLDRSEPILIRSYFDTLSPNMRVTLDSLRFGPVEVIFM